MLVSVHRYRILKKLVCLFLAVRSLTPSLSLTQSLNHHHYPHGPTDFLPETETPLLSSHTHYIHYTTTLRVAMEFARDTHTDPHTDTDPEGVPVAATTCTAPEPVDVTADDNSKFKRQDYWDARFQQEEKYDWLVTYAQVRASLLPHLRQNPAQRILVVGCGNSTFSADLYDDGFHNITNIDFSSVVIDNMRAAHEKQRPEMQWVTMDMCAMTFPADSFDLVLDKAAMDALLVDEGDCWDPEPRVVDDVHRMCEAMARVVTPTGLCLQISFAQPHFRTKYLMGERRAGEVLKPYSASGGRSLDPAYPWHLSHQTLEVAAGCLDCFLYVMSMGD